MSDNAPTTVAQYIQANASAFQANGAPYDPFLIKISTRADQIWSNPNGNQIVNLWLPPSDGDFRPLGGLAVLDFKGPEDHGIVLIKPMPGKESAVADPVGWVFLFDDNGSGSEQEFAAWYPVPPEGYVSFGLWFSRGRNVPPTNTVYCVRSDYAKQLSHENFWSDSDSGLKSDGHLLRGVFTVNSSGSIAESVPGKMLLVPNVYCYGTILEFDGIRPKLLMSLPQALVVAPLSVPDSVVTATPEPTPMSGQRVRDVGTISDRGVRGLTVVPHFAVVDDLQPKRAATSPFYFISSENFYTLTAAVENRSSGEDTLSESVTTGVTSSTTNAFEKETSVKVSANAGVAIGPFSGGASYEMTNTLKISSSDTVSYMTESNRTFTATVHGNSSLERWRPSLGIRLYHSDGTPQATNVPIDAISTDSLLELGFPTGAQSTPTHTAVVLRR